MTNTLQTLSEQLRHPDANTRSRAVHEMVELNDARLLELMLDVLVTERDVFVLEDVTWALVRIGKPAVSPLIALLGHDHPTIRHQAAHVLGKIGSRRATQALIDALRDADAAVVLKAAFALGQLGDSAAVPALLPLLTHNSAAVQSTAHAALESFGEAALVPLNEALSHEAWEVREQAAELLGLIGSNAVVSGLAGALADPAWQVRLAVVMALGSVASPEAWQVLKVMPPDTDERVRALVTRILARRSA